MAPVRHSGWRSRKAIAAVGALVVGFTVATVALFAGRAEFAEWSSFAQVYVPTVLGVFTGGEVAQKIGLARASPYADIGAAPPRVQ